MVLLLISYWVFAMPIGFYLTNYGISVPLGAKGMWIGMIIGLSIFSVFSILRLKWIIHKKAKKFSVQELQIPLSQ